ncbi:MAG: winged helix-turn-helix domain-containing protein [Akkermansiaceae bacterium]
MTESLSPEQARKLALLSQRVLAAKKPGCATAATLAAIQHIGYIQIDTISVIQRAHHHTLWNRNPRYNATQLDQLVDDKQVFEYWSHAAAYLPFCDYRFSQPRKNALARGDQSHWYERDPKMMKHVLKRITTEGPLMAKDFEHTGPKMRDWHSKPAKRALEHLFFQGDLMISKRVNFHKVYDLTERVVPEGTDISEPDEEEYIRFLITSYLKANGMAQAEEIAYLRKNTKRKITATLKDMHANGELIQVSACGKLYYAFPASLGLLDKPLSRRKLKILSPFDNLVIQRKRMNDLFGFDYLIECYVPKAKRQYGYFSLPILWDGKLVARMDCKADRKNSLLHIYHLAMEPDALKSNPDLDAFFTALRKRVSKKS